MAFDKTVVELPKKRYLCVCVRFKIIRQKIYRSPFIEDLSLKYSLERLLKN